MYRQIRALKIIKDTVEVLNHRVVYVEVLNHRVRHMTHIDIHMCMHTQIGAVKIAKDTMEVLHQR